MTDGNDISKAMFDEFMKKTYEDADARTRKLVGKSKILSEHYALYNDYNLWILGYDTAGRLWVGDITDSCINNVLSGGKTVFFPLDKNEQQKVNYFTKEEEKKLFGHLVAPKNLKLSLDSNIIEFSMPPHNSFTSGKSFNKENKDNFISSLSKVYSSVENLTEEENVDYEELRKRNEELISKIAYDLPKKQSGTKKNPPEMVDLMNTLDSLSNIEEINKENTETKNKGSKFLSRFAKWFNR